MSTRRDLMLDKAYEYQDEIMQRNPDGFIVSPYCNSDVVSSAYEAGWEAADKNPIEYNQFRLETDEIIMKLQSQLSLANEKLKNAESTIKEIIKFFAWRRNGTYSPSPLPEFDLFGMSLLLLEQLQSAEATGGKIICAAKCCLQKM